QASRPVAERAAPATASLLSARVLRGLTMPMRENDKPMITSGQATAAAEEMNANTRPARPSTIPAIPRPFRGAVVMSRFTAAAFPRCRRRIGVVGLPGESGGYRRRTLIGERCDR